MQLILIRHSHTVINKDIPNKLWRLSDDGIESVKVLAENELLNDVQLYCMSPQLKAIHTTAILASYHPAPLKVYEGLDETTSVTNQRIEDFPQQIERYLKEPSYSINNGETQIQAHDRFVKTVEQIIEDAANQSLKTVAIVCHGTVLSLFAAHRIDQTPYELHHHIGMPDIASLDTQTKQFIHFFTH